MATSTAHVTHAAPENLEHVRLLLRERRYRRALEAIDRKLSSADTPIPVEDVRTYAYEGMVVHGPSPTWRPPVNLRRGVPVSLRRPIPVDLRRLNRAELERVLRWVLAEELRAIDKAMRVDDHQAALTASDYASRIDRRSSYVAFAQARSLYGLAAAELNGRAPNLDEVADQLHRAAFHANRAGADRTLREPLEKLSVSIDDVTAIVERQRARTAKSDAVIAVVQRFNRLVAHYNDRDQVVSRVQVGNARASLAQIRADVDQLLRQHPADTRAGQLLVDLRGQCARYKLHLERLARAARPD